MKLRSAQLGLLLGLFLGHVAAADGMSQAELLTRSARSIARAGHCTSLVTLGNRVRELDADYYTAEFAPDPVIASCREGQHIEPVVAIVQVEHAPPAPPIVAPVVPHATCDISELVFEPSIWVATDGKVDVRHVMGIGLRDCSDPHGVTGQLGARLDLGHLGAFLGAEAEVAFPIGGARLGVVAGVTGGTGSQLTAGVRLRATNAWVGIDAVHTTLHTTDIARTTIGFDGSDGTTSSTSLMLGAGLSGDAGKAFGVGEAYVLYGAAKVFEFVGAVARVAMI